MTRQPDIPPTSGPPGHAATKPVYSRFWARHDLPGGMPRDGNAPGLQQGEHDGDQGRPDEQAQEAEGEKTAKDAQNGQRHWHLDAEADQPGLDEIVDHADEYAPDDHEYAPNLLVLREQPPRCSTPNYDEQRAADLADREQQSDEAEGPGTGDSGDSEADGKQDRLDGCRADHTVGDAAYRPGCDVEYSLGDRTAEAPECVVQHRNQPLAVDPEHSRHDQRKKHLYQAVGQSSRRTDHDLLQIRGIGLRQRA